MIDAVVVVLNAEILRCVSDALAPFEAQGRLREREEKASFISAQDDKFCFSPAGWQLFGPQVESEGLQAGHVQNMA
jgi:hypothetical protein